MRPISKPWAARKPQSTRFGEAAVPVARANRRRASESRDDVPHRPRRPSYPADRPRDLYESLIRTFGISLRLTHNRNNNSGQLMRYKNRSYRVPATRLVQALVASRRKMYPRKRRCRSGAGKGTLHPPRRSIMIGNRPPVHHPDLPPTAAEARGRPGCLYLVPPPGHETWRAIEPGV